MKVKDLLDMEIDVDVYDNVCEALSIAFCAPIELTEAGKAQFETALNLDVELDIMSNICIVDVDDPSSPDAWKGKLKAAQQFFWSAAGYCPSRDYDKWFATDDRDFQRGLIL